jgi:membrane associated rhomboid family serine protease
MPPACKYLIAANIIVFLLQIFVTRQPGPEEFRAYVEQHREWFRDIDPEELPEYLELPPISIVQEWFQLETDKVLRQGQIWRLLTCAFCHDRHGIWHIVVNMLFLFWFGKTLEAMYGTREFVLFYLTAAIVASLAYVGLDCVTGESVPAIGASGAVMAVTMLYAIHYPRDTIYVFWVFPLEVRWLVAIYVVFDLHPVLLALAGDRQFTGVAHAAHLGGLAFGFLYWKFNLRLERGWQRLPFRGLGALLTRRSHLRVYAPPQEKPHDELDSRLDAILEKIHAQGSNSLTEEEREILVAASKRYRNRPGG